MLLLLLSVLLLLLLLLLSLLLFLLLLPLHGIEGRILFTADIAPLLFKEELKNTVEEEDEEEGGMGDVMRGADGGKGGRGMEASAVANILPSDFLGFDFNGP